METNGGVPGGPGRFGRVKLGQAQTADVYLLRVHPNVEAALEMAIKSRDIPSLGCHRSVMQAEQGNLSTIYAECASLHCSTSTGLPSTTGAFRLWLPLSLADSQQPLQPRATGALSR